MKKRCECGFKVKVTCKLIHWEPGNGTEGSGKQVVPQVIPNPYLRGSITVMTESPGATRSELAKEAPSQPARS